MGSPLRTSHVREVLRPSRRTFVKGLAVGGAVAGLGWWEPFVRAQTAQRQPPAELRGTEFDLRIEDTPMNVTGSPRMAVTVNGAMPAPTLRWRDGHTVTVRGANALDSDAAHHTHGVMVPVNIACSPRTS